MDLNSRRVWWVLIVISGIWLLWMTLRPDQTLNQINLIPMAEHGQALVCLLRGTCLPQQVLWFLLIDVLGNIIVFVPLGLGLAGVIFQTNPRQTVGRTALAGFLFSLTIELIQLTIPTRATDIDDLIFNTLGVTLGALLFIRLYRSKFSILRD